MNVLIVGGGGREHAIARSLSKSDKIAGLFCAPGNPGIAQYAKCLPAGAEDVAGIVAAAVGNSIDFVVIGPEVPLALGIVDALEKSGIKAFGPNKKCARLEASKAFTKDFLIRHNIPTAKYREFTDKNELTRAVGIFGYPMVIKADGLAAGKGVAICGTEAEAMAAIEQMMDKKVFGAAGEKVVVEEFLRGTEASVLCFVDEKNIVPMETAQDYKRIYDGDRGPNTGGMGAYSPSLLFNAELEKQVMDEILLPTLRGFQEDGLDFKGVLFAGLMITEEGPKVIEFNNRFGDPETQVVLPRLETDLLEILLAVAENRLGELEIKWNSQNAVCVVMASGGYPESSEKGRVISGLEHIDDDIMVFHAGTATQDGEIVTSGGRVLGITALAGDHEGAMQKAYKNVEKISFDKMQYRKDIGLIIQDV